MRPVSLRPRSALRLGAALLAVPLAGCYSFSSYQSARLLDPGQAAFGIALGRQGVSIGGPGGGETEDISVLDLQVRGGVSRYHEMGFKLSRIRFEDGWQFIAISSKFAVVTDYVALDVPVGTFFGRGIDSKESFQIHPTLIGRVPVDPRTFEFDIAVKGLLFPDEALDNALAINFGPRLSLDLSRWAVHPEVGVLFESEPDRTWWQVGVGVEYRRRALAPAGR